MSRVGDQLSLFQNESSAHVRAPWGGGSARVLTKSYKRFILKAQAGKSVSGCVSDENQYDLWLPIAKAPWKFQGAPLLVEPEEV